MKKVLFIVFILITYTALYGQFKKTAKEFSANTPRFEVIEDVTNIKGDSPEIESSSVSSNFAFSSIEKSQIKKENFLNVQPIWTNEREIPLAIYGTVNLELANEKDIEELTFTYLENIESYLGVEGVKERFFIINVEEDDLGITHVKLKQHYKGIPIYGGEIIIHIKNNNPYFLNGYWYPEIPTRSNEMNLRSDIDLKKIITDDLGPVTSFRNFNKIEKKLLDADQWEFEKVYHKNGPDDELTLSWKVNVHPNLGQEYVYFIENRTGEIKHKYQQICNLHHNKTEVKTESMDPSGGETAWATDLLGITREIQVFNHLGNYYMIDASRDMYNSAQSSMPNDPVGVIWTLDAQFTSPENNDFNVEHLQSSNNDWNDKIAVSAHYNAQEAYNYFNNTHNRNSINGQGGNIISLINVMEGDGSHMDNAFWSGKAMFYGNGNEAFYPLAGSLDVAGHEMTHGVISNEANLEYYGEPGAINESFADIFGVMIDREDWKLGEDVVFTNVFTSGALRDVSNPHNGGSSLNDIGYQPAHVNEQYMGQEDNAGVHINSGIPNYAFYKFATAVGKEKAEQVYYKALTSYLTKSSRFVDLRVAIEQAAYDLYGTQEKDAAASAFEAVGITGGSGTGEPNDYQDDLEINPGNDLVLYYDEISGNLVLGSGSGSVIQDPFSTTQILSKPSISDNGSEIVFVSQDRQIHYIYIDWSTGQYEESIIQNETIWRNVVISKDGWRIAAITETLDNNIHVFDFGLNSWNVFEIYNPSTAEGISAGDVDFIDIMEFNYSGEWIMYDAQNTIKSDFGNDIEYWDIGFVQVFNNNTGNYSDGLIQKLFSGLPENTSIGNPTFSKNSPYIIAFDYLVGDFEYYLLGSNLETGEVSQIYESLDLTYPNYSRLDDQLLFDYNGFFGTDLGVLGVGNNKISYVPNSDKILYTNASWGTWFSNGSRSLSLGDKFKLTNISEPIVISPNPNNGNFKLTGEALSGAYQVKLFDIMGEVIYSAKIEIPGTGFNLNLDQLNISDGSYFLTLKNSNQVLTKKLLIH